MASASYAQNSFTGGELAKSVQGRFDEPIYKTALNVCFNAIPTEEGSWCRRPGMMFAGFSRRGAAGRLIAFDLISSAPLDFELTPGFLRVWQGQALALNTAPAAVSSFNTASPVQVTMGAAQTWDTGDSIQFFVTPDTNYLLAAYLANRQFVVTKIDTTHFTLADQLGNNLDGNKFSLGSSTVTAARIFEVATPWGDQPTILNVRISQSEEQVLMFCYQVQTQLFAIGENIFGTQKGFTLAPAAFIDGPYLDPPTDGSSVQSSATSGTATLTFSSSRGFTADDVGRNIRLLSEPPNWVASTSYSPGDKTKYNGSYYNCIVATGTSNPPDTTPASQALCPSAAQWCYGVVTGFTDDATVTVTLANIPKPPGPTIVITPVQNPLLYTHDSDNPITTYQLGLYTNNGPVWPTCGASHEGRFWFAGGVQNRIDSGVANNGLTCSPTYYDGTVADDNGISAPFNFPEIMAINWMQPTDRGLLCGTQTGEVLVQSSQLSDPITPTSIQAHIVTRYGGANIEPLRIGYSSLFVQRYAKKVLDFTSDVFSGRHSAINVALPWKHLAAPGIAEIRFMRELAPVMWATVPNGQGNWIGMSYKRDSFYSSQGPTFNGGHIHEHGGNRYPVSIATGTALNGQTDTLAMLTAPDNTTPPYHVEFLAQIYQEGDSVACSNHLDDSIVPTAANVVYSGGVPAEIVLYGFWHGIGETITAFIGGLDCGDYVVATDGSITVPFAPTNTFQPLFTFAFLQGLTAACNTVQFIGGAPYTAPVFLSEPAVQSYVDPVIGAVGWSSAAAPGLTNVLGATSGNHILSQFDFANGAFVSRQDVTALGVYIEFSSNITIGPDGKVWTINDVGPVKSLAHIDQTAGPPWVLSDQWGAWNAGPPSGTLPEDNHAILTMGSTHWYVQAGFATTENIVVYRADPPAYPTGSFGFWGHAYFNSLASGADCCSVTAGPQSASSATAYWTAQPYNPGSGAAGQVLGKTVISSGADSYSPSIWPTANSDIASTTIKSYAPTDFDASWTAFSGFGGPAYDQTDGNVIVWATGTGGGSPAYIAKVSVTDGAVLWKVAISDSTGFDPQSMTNSRIQAGTYYYYEKSSTWGGVVHAIETSNGTDTTQAYTGLGGISQQVSDDQLGCIMGNVTWNTADGTLTLLNSTAASGATMGTVYFADGQEPLAAVVATGPGLMGFTYNSDGQLLRPLDPERSGARNGPALGKKRRTHQTAFLFTAAITESVSIGTSFPPPYPCKFLQNDGDVEYSALNPFTGVFWQTIDDNYSFDGMIAWRIGRPYPLIVSAIEGFVETQDR